MTKHWEEFEQLVARFEQLRLNDHDIEVQWNAKINDRRTGSKRQIDVLLIRKSDPTDIVIIECRRRAKLSDIGWIDGIVGKRAAVDARQAIAVSNKKLSSNAMAAAKFDNIIVRTISELSLEEVIEWFPSKELIVFQSHKKFININIKVCNKDKKIDDRAARRLNRTFHYIMKHRGEPLLHDKSSNSSFSIADLWHKFTQVPLELSKLIYAQSPDSGATVEFLAKFHKSPLNIVNLSQDFGVCHIRFDVGVKVTKKEYYPVSVHDYTEGEASLSQRLNYSAEVDGKNVEITLIKNEQGINIQMPTPTGFEVEFEQN